MNNISDSQTYTDKRVREGKATATHVTRKRVSARMRRWEMLVAFLTIIITGATRSTAQSPDSERLVSFIKSPPSIREMVVECIWNAKRIEDTRTNWIALCLQTNAYIFRMSKREVGLYDLFDTNKDEMITVRSGEVYSSVSYYKVLGVHAETVLGLSGNGERDIVSPKIRGQAEAVVQPLAVGLPVSVAVTNGAFTCRDESAHQTLSGVMVVNSNGLIAGFNLTNSVDRGPGQEKWNVPMSVKYEYEEGTQPHWFPHHIEREVSINRKTYQTCRFVTHRLELGSVPLGEFYPERFIPGSSASKVITSNGVSYITINGLTKPVADQNDPKAQGIPTSVGRRRVVHTILVIAVLLLPLRSCLKRPSFRR
jgi:hypothetical protein